MGSHDETSGQNEDFKDMTEPEKAGELESPYPASFERTEVQQKLTEEIRKASDETTTMFYNGSGAEVLTLVRAAIVDGTLDAEQVKRVADLAAERNKELPRLGTGVEREAIQDDSDEDFDIAPKDFEE